MLDEVDDVPKSLREAAYVVVGFGVIGFQRAQVRRREIARQLPGLAAHMPAAAREALDAVTSALRGEPPHRPGS